MSLVLADRVRETTQTTGTGTITLAGAVDGFQSFSVIGNNNTTYYTIASTTQWEVGIGQYYGGTLSRDTILASSTGSVVNLSAGSKDVFVTYPASKSINQDANGAVAFNGQVGTLGQVLQSNATSAPTWVTPSSGTVTSVSGAGTVSGLTLSGTVTNSGSLTLGGAITGFATSGANTNITSIALTTGTISTAPSASTDIVNKTYADGLAAKWG